MRRGTEKEAGTLMMKQLDFFFDFFSQMMRQRPKVAENTPKTLVMGGRREPQEILLVHGRTIRVRRKSYQRTISLNYRPDGVISVIAARTIPVKMITRFVMENWAWVEEQQLRFREIRERFPKKKFEPGEYFPFLGVEHSLQLAISKSRRPNVYVNNGHIIVEIPEKLLQSREMLQASLKAIIRSHYEEEGKRVLAERVFHYSQKLQLFPQSVSYRCQKTRWGSCSPGGGISLNWRLVAAPLEVIDYVVVHELCHLKHLNHSKTFWKLVEEQSPKWRKIRRWLHENQYAFDFLMERSELHPENDA